MSRQIRRSRLARALHLALGLALGVALHAASVGAQWNSVEQIPPGDSIGNPGYDFETSIGDFAVADLEGYWTGVVFSDSTSANDPGIKVVDLGVDDQGQLGGYTVDEEGDPVDPEFGGWLIDFDNSTQTHDMWKVESGSLQIDSMGAVSGTIYVEGETRPGEFSFLQLNEARDVFAGVINPNPNGGEAELAAFAKIDPDFDYTTADLEGTWAVFVFSENTQANDPGAGHGVFEIDASGTVIGGSKDGPSGDEDWPPGLQFTIDAFGRIAETSGGLGGEPVLQLAQGRQIAVGSAIGFLPGGEDDHRIIFFVKKTSGVASSQLAGDFLVFSFEDDKQVNEPATGQGGVFFDPTGTQLLGGILYWSDSPSEPDSVPPHTVDVQPGGEVTLTLNALEAWGDDTSGQVTETPLGQGFTAIAVGSYHSLALRTDGLIVAWGDEYIAEGIGPLESIPTGIGHIAISAGSSHSLAIDSNGALVQWGIITAIPPADGSPPPGNDFVAIDAAGGHSIALRSDGTIESWGWLAPCAHTGAPTGTGHLAISAGYPNLAVRADGSVAAWGCGQFTPPPSDLDFTDVAAGDGFGLAIRTDGSIKAWGDDTWGQVSSAPTATGYVAIAAGYNTGYGYGIALQESGSIDAWGYDGQGSSSTSSGPTAPPGSNFVAIDAASANLLALRQGDSPLTLQFSPAAGIMIGTQVNEGDDPQIILAFVPEPGAALLGLAALAVLGALGRRRFKTS